MSNRRRAVPPLGIDWTPEQLQKAVSPVRAGRTLTPKAWPNGARVAVNIGFDVDNELLSRATPLPAPLSQGEYGAVTALPRILALLDKHQIPASFFVPAVSAMFHPDMVPAIMKSRRHEIGVHGWIHENNPTLTLPLLLKAGFLYDSSLMAMDEPYEIVSDGARRA